MHSGGQLELRFLPAETNHPVDKPVAHTQSGIDAELTLACVELARDLGLKNLAGKLSVVWNPRMRSTAGRAFWPEGKIELNPKLKPDKVIKFGIKDLKFNLFISLRPALPEEFLQL